jgi:hypothetical protein
MIISLLLLFTVAGICQDKVSAGDVVDKIGQGSINWSAGYIEAVGIGALSDKLISKINARPIAMRAAKVDALHNLLEIIKNVQVNSAKSVKDFTGGNNVIDSKINTLAKKSLIDDYQYMSGGKTEIRLRVPLYGDLARIIMPLAMVDPPATPVTSALEAPANIVCTGIVVDAREIQARPAILPRIFDEDGREVYGSANIDLEYAVKEGMSGYSKDLNTAQSNQRVKGNPLTIKALKTSGPGKSDIIISNGDARQVRSSAEKTSFLKQCKVIIVLD